MCNMTSAPLATKVGIHVARFARFMLPNQIRRQAPGRMERLFLTLYLTLPSIYYTF